MNKCNSIKKKILEMMQDNEEQIIDDGVGLALDTLTFDGGKLLKSGVKIVSKRATKITVKKI